MTSKGQVQRSGITQQHVSVIVTGCEMFCDAIHEVFCEVAFFGVLGGVVADAGSHEENLRGGSQQEKLQRAKCFGLCTGESVVT